jgi:hypothetical protein
MSITTPSAARLGLEAPVWPVTGSYVEARLYALDDAASGYVLVVRRQREELDRFPLDAARRAEIAGVIARAGERARAAVDSAPAPGSEIVRGGFVVNQTILGAALFGPAAAAAINEPAAGSAAYLLITGTSFFLSAQRAKASSVTKAQNHLSWHGARQGAAAAVLAMVAVGGDAVSDDAYAWTLLAGGIAGDVIGYVAATKLTDAEAHGVSHGATALATLAAGVAGAGGLYGDGGDSGRGAAGAILGAGLLGYPLGLRYARGSSYTISAGDVGTLGTSELIGVAAAASLLSDSPEETTAFSLLTAGYLLGAIAGDRLWVKPYDFTVPEARLLQFGAIAGGLMGAAIPVLAQANDPRPVFAASAIGAMLGAMVSMNNIEPRRASRRGAATAPGRSGRAQPQPWVDLQLTPQVAALAGLGHRGTYPLASLRF